MNGFIKSKIAAVGLVGFLSSTTCLFALGVRIPNQDAEAIARGNAFVATANNPSAIYYNPAGIGQLTGQNVQVGVLNYLGINTEYKSLGGHTSETDSEIVPVPQLYYTFRYKDQPWSAGLGLYSPFGLVLEWPDDSGFRSLAIGGRLTYLSVNPVLAYQLHPTLSIAAGPMFNYSSLKLRQGIGLPPAFGGVQNDEFIYRGDDFGYGFNAGILWQPHQKWSLGGAYRSGSTLEYQGSSQFKPYAAKQRSRVEIDFPQMVSGGISFRPTPRWNFEASADYTDWSSVDEIDFRGTVNPLTGGGVSLPLHWHSSWFLHFGGTHYWPNGYFASLGYFFSENSTSEKYFTPVIPDTDLHVGSVGGGYKGEHWRWALAGQIITGPWRNIRNSQTNPLTGENANGRYRLIVPAVTFSLGYHF
jgi:long-chain fatty acid transport protein